MKVKVARRGGLAVSTSGHDTGTWYVITEVEKDRLKLCEGRLHPFSKPKLKNMKHVQLLPMMVNLEESSPYGGVLKDSDLRKQIEDFKQNYRSEIEYRRDGVDRINHGEECALVQE